MAAHYTRRSVLGLGAAGVAATVVGFPGLGLAQTPVGRKPRNVIFFVSDGMSAGVPAMLDQYLQMSTGRGSIWAWLMRRPEVAHGSMDTRSLSSLVTDSAAASSAWGSGVRCWNGQINTLPDGTVLRPIYDVLLEARVRRGLVTTTTLTHATPAGFAVSIDQRDKEPEIAEKYLLAGCDVYLGGGQRFFDPALRADRRDLYAEFKGAGYAVVGDRAGLMGAPAQGKLLGAFSPSHLPYTVDQMHTPEIQAKVPTLREMTEAALERLAGGSEGFVLQVEGGRVDHAAHANDLAGLVHDQRAFEEALELALTWAEKDGQTLVVVTSDHGNSNPGLVGGGPEYGESTHGLRKLGGMKASFNFVLDGVEATKGIASVSESVADRLGLTLSEDEAALVLAAIQGKSPLKMVEHYDQPTSALALATASHTHVCWSGRQHTSDHTIVTAVGPGQELFRGLIDNVSVFGTILGLYGLRHENPSMSVEDAERAMQKRRGQLTAAIEGHWA